MLVSERDALMDEIADCLNAGPTRRSLAEQFPGQVQQLVAVAEAACQEEDESLVGQSSSTATWLAVGNTGSGNPVSLTTASVVMHTRPAGARILLHQLPKPSR